MLIISWQLVTYKKAHSLQPFVCSTHGAGYPDRQGYAVPDGCPISRCANHGRSPTSAASRQTSLLRVKLQRLAVPATNYSSARARAKISHELVDEIGDEALVWFLPREAVA